MVTIAKTGSTFFVSGSTKEGAAYARHFAQQPMQDLDFMLVEGTITSSDCLIKLQDAEGFVHVKYDEKSIQQFSKTPLSTKQNQNQILCINGLKMKEKYCGTDSISFLPTLELTATGQTAVNSASVEVKFKSNLSTMSLGEQFENALNSIRRIRAQENIELLQPKYILACNAYQKSISQYVSPLLNTIFVAEGFTVQSFQDAISLIFPAYNIQMPQVNKLRLNALLEFYEKYKYLGNPSILENYIEYGQLSMDNEADFVPALQLEFWPSDVQRFFDRIQLHRPELYKLIIETSSMHLIPKWSTKTSDIDKELEFRYSFSEIERLLAMKRTRVEQILNGVARSIYYKYLKKQTSSEDNNKALIPSYFIKTTVLWMCELNNLSDQFTDMDDDQTIARIMAEEWLEYAKQLLSDGVCKHYFIDDINLLESCSSESLAKALDILEHQVNLDEDITIEIYAKQNELINKQRPTMEDWLCNLKIQDVLNAVSEYKLLKENWLCPPIGVLDEGDIACLRVLSLLRTLDGNKQENWTTFKRLFLDIDETNCLPPIWGEQVENYSIPDFADNVLALGTLLNQIQIIMEKPDFDGTMNIGMSPYELTGGQNILNDLITPSNMVGNGLMNAWLPMFTCPYFNALPRNVSANALSSFQHRSIIDNHPIGPLNNLLQDRSLPSTLNSSTQQKFHQDSQHASDDFLNLLRSAPDYTMTIDDFRKYYDKPSISSQTERKHVTNASLINKEELTLIVFDPNLNIEHIEEDIYRSINDYVLFYTDKSQLLSHVQFMNEEKLFVIIFDLSIDEIFLSQLQNINQIDSIYIYSSQQDNYNLLMNKYSKIVSISAEKTFLFEQIRIHIEQQLSTLTFGFYNPQQILTTHTKLSKENAFFLWNLLLKDLLMNYFTTDKNVMIQNCREYYSKNRIEMENIEQYEGCKNAHEWYFKNCFISKQLSKAFYTMNIEQLKLFSSVINDLSSNIKETYSIDKVYCTTIVTTDQYEMLLKNIGQLIIFDRFLVMNCSPTEIAQRRSDTQVVVSFEVVNASASHVYSIDSNRIIFDLGTVFQFGSFEFDDNLKSWIARLIVSNNSAQIAQEYILTQQQRMERMTLPIIMGDLLLIFSDLSKTKTFFENLQNEDDALIFYYYGQIHYQKKEYDLALENFQISCELMKSDERFKDSAFVLHDIGYVYDRTKEFKQALDCHREALEIRETYSVDGVYIGISLYNIGRTLVNMEDNDQALIYHQRALKIWKQILTDDHRFIAQSLHSHGVVYFNKRDYVQASYYYTKALELYEMNMIRDDYGILMVKNNLEDIKKLSFKNK